MAKVLLPIGFVVIFGALFWRQLVPAPQTLIQCAFIQKAGSPPITTVGGKRADRRLWLEGILTDPFQRNMFHFEGSTIGMGSAPTSGNVWLNDDGMVEGIAVYAAYADIRPENLTIATLGKNGQLDTDRSTAFVFIDPREKLLHPADYHCRVSRR